jgi:hypothetical protein
MVEVFKTNISNLAQANQVIKLLQQQFPLAQITIDLDDCDRILRMENVTINPHQVTITISQLGFYCQVLD